METKLTVDSLIDLSPQVKNFLNDRRSLSVVPRSYEEMLKDPLIFPRLVILALTESDLLLSYLLKATPTSTYDPELLGYSLFMGNLVAVKAFEDRLSKGDSEPIRLAKLDWLTLDYLSVIGKIQESECYVNDPVNIAILSDDTKVLDYVASKVPIGSDAFIEAAGYSKIKILKQLYNPSIKPAKVEEALELALSNSWSEGVDFLVDKVSNVSNGVLIEGACYGDPSVFMSLVKTAKLEKESLMKILIQVYRLDRLVETKKLIELIGLTKEDIEKLEMSDREKELLTLMI